MNTHLIPANGVYSNPAIEAHLQTKHEEYLPKAGLLGVTTAVKINLHPETPFKVLCEPIETEYNTLIAQTHKLNEGYLNVMQGKLDIEKLQDENVAIAQAIEKTEGELAIEKHTIGEVHIPEKSTRRLLFALLIGAIILFSDAYFLGTAFQQTGSPLLVSIFLGIACSLSIAVIATLGTKYTEKLKDKKMRFLAVCGLGAVVGISVYILSDMRNSYYKSASGGDISAWKLAVLSILTFIAFHFLYKHAISPALAQRRERRNALQKVSKLKKIESTLNYLKHSYAENLQKINAVKQQRLAVLAYAKSTEQHITKLYKVSIAEFKKHFIQQAGYVPATFNQDAPDLSRFYDNIILTPINTNTYEKPE